MADALHYKFSPHLSLTTVFKSLIKSLSLHAHTARPKIAANPCIEFGNNAEPTATVVWQIQQPLSIQLSRYNLLIYKKGRGSLEEWVCVHTEHVPCVLDQNEQHCRFSVPELETSKDEFDYEVKIEAERVDHQKIYSDQTAMTIVNSKFVAV